MGMAVVTLKKGEGRLLKSGGMWIFDNEIDTIMGSFENGDMVLVHDFDGYPMGRGFINTNSKITVRLMTRDENVEINEELLEKRVRDAWEYRKKVTDTSSCRVIFGEADFVPGFVADKFSDVLVIQSLALGIDRYKEVLVELLKKVLAEDGVRIRGVYERSDVKVRRQEGMEPYYPVNDEKNQSLYKQYAKLAEDEKHVIFGGRLGEYKYYDMDAVIAAALDMSERELG